MFLSAGFTEWQFRVNSAPGRVINLPSRYSSEFLIATLINYRYICSCLTVNTEIRGTELRSVSTTAFARLQPCFFDSHAHCLMIGRLTLMTRCATSVYALRPRWLLEATTIFTLHFPTIPSSCVRLRLRTFHGERFHGRGTFCVLAANCKICERWVVWRVKSRNTFETFSVGITLLVIDYLHTLELEIELIWCKKWGLVKILFLCSRYSAFFDTPLVLYYSLAPHISTKVQSSGHQICQESGHLSTRNAWLFIPSRLGQHASVLRYRRPFLLSVPTPFQGTTEIFSFIYWYHMCSSPHQSSPSPPSSLGLCNTEILLSPPSSDATPRKVAKYYSLTSYCFCCMNVPLWF